MSRLHASAEAWAYALNEANPRHMHRDQPKLRLRKEMLPSMPERNALNARSKPVRGQMSPDQLAQAGLDVERTLTHAPSPTHL